jgi:hypothetical protein
MNKKYTKKMLDFLSTVIVGVLSFIAFAHASYEEDINLAQIKKNLDLKAKILEEALSDFDKELYQSVCKKLLSNEFLQSNEKLNLQTKKLIKTKAVNSKITDLVFKLNDEVYENVELIKKACSDQTIESQQKLVFDFYSQIQHSKNILLLESLKETSHPKSVLSGVKKTEKKAK